MKLATLTVTVAAILSPLARPAPAADIVYNPPSVTEYYFGGNLALDGDVDAYGEDLGANSIDLAFAGVGGPDTLTWKYTYQLKEFGLGPGYRVTSATKCDVDAIRFTASTSPGGATCKVEFWFIGLNAEVISKVYTWDDVQWNGTQLVIDENDTLGSLRDLGEILGFGLRLTMLSGAVSIAKIDVQWEAGSVGLRTPDPGVIYTTGSGQVLRYDPTNSGNFSGEYWIGWFAGDVGDDHQLWQLQAVPMHCYRNKVTGIDLFYEENPDYPFDSIKFKVWHRDGPMTFVTEESLPRVEGQDDPGTPGTDTLLHRYEVTPFWLTRPNIIKPTTPPGAGHYWFTAYAEGTDAVFEWRTNALGGYPVKDAMGAFGWHSENQPSPGFEKFRLPATQFLALEIQNADHLYNTAFTIRGEPYPYADCEADGDLDVFDFLCFQAAFQAKNAYADCEEDGDLDVYDFTCFMNLYALRCPHLPPPL